MKAFTTASLRWPIFDPSCKECGTGKCQHHCFAIKCATCGEWLYDKFYASSSGELPRPHHLPEEGCANEDPVRVFKEDQAVSEEDLTHPRTIVFWLSRAFVALALVVFFGGGAVVLLKVSGDTVNDVLHDAAWEATTRAEVAALDSEIAGIRQAQEANEKARQREWIHHETTAKAATDLNDSFVRVSEKRDAIAKKLVEHEARKAEAR